MYLKEEHDSKADLLICFSVLGRFIAVRDLHSENVSSSMVVTGPTIVTVSRDLQQRNADFPMWLTDSGMIMDFNIEHNSNAESEIVTTESGIVTLVISDLHGHLIRIVMSSLYRTPSDVRMH